MKIVLILGRMYTMPYGFHKDYCRIHTTWNEPKCDIPSPAPQKEMSINGCIVGNHRPNTKKLKKEKQRDTKVKLFKANVGQ